MSDNLPVQAPVSGNLSKLTAGKAYLRRISLLQSGSELVKAGSVERGGVFVHHPSKDVVEKMGTEFQALLIGYRPRADHWAGGILKSISYDDTSDAFLEIARRAPTCKFGDPESFRYGPEFIFYIPSINAGHGGFVTFYCHNVSQRRAAAGADAHVGKPVTVRAKFTKTAQHSFHVFEIVPFSGTLSPEPSKEDYDEAVRLFQDRPSTPEKAASSGVEQ